jgi:uncharacterized protein YjbI with pentapeptide repeats
MDVLFLVIGGVGLLGGVAYAVLRRSDLDGDGVLFAVVGALAVAVFGGITGWLLTAEPQDPADALRTGGLVALGVLALYGLWLADRRRRIEQARGKAEQERQQAETRRTDQDRQRLAGERFAQAVGLLGAESDAVRVGALHAIGGIGKAWPEFTQAAVDVFCAYLRMPFDDSAKQREREVRLTAQRLIEETLGAASGDGCRLDLTGAMLEDFSLRDVTVRSIVARADFHGATVFSRVQVYEELILSGARLHDMLSMTDCVVGDLRFSGTTFGGPVLMNGTRLHKATNASGFRFEHGLFARKLTCDEPVVWSGRFDTGAVLEDAVFTGGLRLVGSSFTGEANFRGAFLGPASHFSDVAFDGLDLSVGALPPGFAPHHVYVRHEATVNLPPGFGLSTPRDGLSQLSRNGSWGQ